MIQSKLQARLQDPRVFQQMLDTQFEIDARAARGSQLHKWFPDKGEFARELYPKHLGHFARSLDQQVRLFMAGNQSGKSSAGCYENTLHLTGLYPPWWDGRRFEGPTKGWIIADTAKTIRETLQVIMFGERVEIGTGMIPAAHIIKTTPKHGTPDAIDQGYIRHVSGGISKMTFKSYAEEEDSFRGSVLDFVHLDEGCPLGIFSECVTRVMTKQGLVSITVTPMKSFSELIDNLLEAATNRKQYDHILGG